MIRQLKNLHYLGKVKKTDRSFQMENIRPTVLETGKFRTDNLKGCIRYIFVSLFCMSKREHL